MRKHNGIGVKGVARYLSALTISSFLYFFKKSEEMHIRDNIIRIYANTTGKRVKYLYRAFGPKTLMYFLSKLSEDMNIFKSLKYSVQKMKDGWEVIFDAKIPLKENLDVLMQVYKIILEILRGIGEHSLGISIEYTFQIENDMIKVRSIWKGK